MKSLSLKGLKLLKVWEGCILHIYKDSAGYPTIGVGHLIRAGEDFSKGLTNEQAMELLAADISPFEDVVNAKIGVDLTQDQFDALVIFAFNIGTGGFAKSTLVKELNLGHYDQVPTQLRKWNRAGGKVNQGLINRRNNEIKLWQGGY